MTHPAIAIENLSVSFTERGQKVDALRGLSLTVKEGTVFGFLGPNGAGKTTTMHALLGFVAFNAGTAQIFGRDVREAIARTRIGYLPENPQTYPFLTGRELLSMAGRLFHLDAKSLHDRVEELLDRVNLRQAANRRIATYSRGMMQRIGLAQALINDPDLVILDEPTGGMDPLGRMEIRRIIAQLRERGKTVFFSSHELSEVELVCDHVAILSQGRVMVEGAAADLVKKDESLEQYFLRVVAGKGGGS
ncbi:MAG TPA: ABC transporter [Verrucomicrobia bacterium]|nr:MAG: ABC transporter [Lentisphaerae bacterium GWF2_57_35]HBA85852.1 ABC transporter [Verrucomicrobiota bacterium]